MRAQLTIEAGQGEPRVCQLDPDKPVTLGRQRGNAIVLHDEHASRLHAEVFFDDGRWYIRDSGTLNGTRVNGAPLGAPLMLEHGQIISIGRTFLRFAAVPSCAPCEGSPATESPAVHLDLPPGLFDPEQTVLRRDELGALCQFMAESVKQRDPRALIANALQTIHAQVDAAVTGFLNLDQEAPLPRIVFPSLARVDIQLSRQLTQTVQREGRAVWLGGRADLSQSSESLAAFADALCIPLLAGEAPLGAVHVYRGGRLFTEHEARFCEVLAGHLANSLQVLRAQRTLTADNSRLRSQAPGADEIVGKSLALQEVRQLIAKFAPRPATVLIVGESGAGKELVALALHRQSARRSGPMVSVNCAAIAPALLESELFGHCRGAFSGADRDHAGLFQQADEGTLFLDEVGELSLECQAKLLRVLESKNIRPVGTEGEVSVDVRVIAATHRNLERDVQNGRFRQDLFFRLQGLQIRVPPLREHVEDIPELADSFLERLAVVWGRRARLHPRAIRALQEFSWPGNVRQLRSVLENAMAQTDEEVLLPSALRLAPVTSSEEPASLNLEHLEAWAVRSALRQTRGNLAQAARLLGVVRETVRALMKKYDIDKDDLEN